MLSIVIPAYNEEGMIKIAAETISQLMEKECIEYEIIFINDGSKDNTWASIRTVASINYHIRGASFSRNFGKESAIFAGLSEAKGDCVVVIDCDLQHPPEKIVDMFRLWEHGYEIIEGVKSNRGRETGSHRIAANIFYAFMSNATGIDMANASDFKLLDRKAVNVLLNMPEKNAFFRALSSWIGFNSTRIEYEVQERVAGESKWSTFALIKYAITNITSFTTAPMQIVTLLGVITFVVSLTFSICTLYQKIIGVALEGFTTIIILLGFIGSIIMISLGIIGYYIAKVYEEIKCRPRFIVAERIN